MRLLRQLVSLLCLFYVAYPLSATANDLSSSAVKNSIVKNSVVKNGLDLPELKQLSARKQWSQLLHYRFHPYTLRTQSQNDSPEFFLAVDGKTDLYAEMVADVNAFQLTGLAPDASAQCRFPARYFWLKARVSSVTFIDQPCPTFDTWRDEIDAYSLTLVFPASHINSPSSMYGHTLIRMDKKDPNSSKLLAYAVNFSANADRTDNELVFTYKGLTGGYPGEVSVTPYYAKTNEYQHMEYRDIWEYRLSFNEAEVAQFVRHIWEVQNTSFDYFFFDENCSYRLLTLLDAASPQSDMADDFVLKAVPVDTIRAVAKSGFVYDTDYRPSASAQMEAMSQQASAEEIAVAHLLVETDEDIDLLLSSLSSDSQAKALELAHAYARYLSIKKKKSSPELRKRNIALLSARSKLTAGSPFKAPRKPVYRDDQGHGSSRLTFAGGVSDGKRFGELGWRISYHDMLDPAVGFLPGSQIQMGDFRFRYNSDDGIQLQSLMLVDVLSLSNVTEFQSPVAWGVNAGFDRFAAEGSELYSFLNVGFGRAWAFNWLNDKTPPSSPFAGVGRVYALLDVHLRADNQFDSGGQLTLGPRLGWLWQGNLTQELVEFRWQPAVLGDRALFRSLRIEEALSAPNNQQVRFQFERQWLSSDLNQLSSNAVVNEWKIGYSKYF